VVDYTKSDVLAQVLEFTEFSLCSTLMLRFFPQISKLYSYCVFSNLQKNGKIHLTVVFLKEVISQSKDVLDDAAITEIIKTCNVIKNEKVQEAKRKVKGQANKAKKVDKVAEAKAKKLQIEVFGDSNDYDDYDQIGEKYEDDFF
jgi:hypothetical protein